MKDVEFKIALINTLVFIVLYRFKNYIQHDCIRIIREILKWKGLGMKNKLKWNGLWSITMSAPLVRNLVTIRWRSWHKETGLQWLSQVLGEENTSGALHSGDTAASQTLHTARPGPAQLSRTAPSLLPAARRHSHCTRSGVCSLAAPLVQISENGVECIQFNISILFSEILAIYCL